MSLAPLRQPFCSIRYLSAIFSPRSLLRFICRPCQQELNPVLKSIFGKHEDHLLEVFFFNAALLRDSPKLVFQLVAVLHVVIKISPYHQRRVATPLQTALQLSGHSRYQFGSSSAIFSSEEVIALLRSNPCGVKFLQQTEDENRINAAALFPFVQADDLRAASHEPTPLRWPHRR